MATATQITTGRVRFSYVNAFTPRAAQEGAQPKYSVTLLIPKTDKNTIAKIKAAIEAAKTAYLQKHSGKKLPSALKTTLHDGDGERPNGGEPLSGGVVTDSDWDDDFEDEDDELLS